MSNPYGTFQQLQLDKLTEISSNTSSNASPTTSQLIGNTVADGSGDHNHLHVDGNGIAKTQVVNAVNVIPHATLNAESASNNSSVASTLKGRTDIADETSGEFLLCDSSGNLNIRWTNTPNVKLEDLSSSINADNSNHSRSIAVGLRARQTIGDSTTGTFLRCDSNGFLDVRDHAATVIAPNLVTADTTQLQRVYSVLHDTTNNQMKAMKCDSSGFLEVRDNNKTVIAPNLVTADTTQLPRVYQVLHDVTNNNMRSAKCDGAGSQFVRLDNKTVATGSYAEDTIFPRNYLSLHDVGNQVSRTARCDANGDLVVVNSSLNSNVSGELKVIQESTQNKGSQSNIQDGTLNFGNVSSSVDVSDINHAVFLYEDTNTSTFDNPKVEVSVDNTNFVQLGTQPLINTGVSKREGSQEYKLHGIKYLRIRNDSTADNFTNAKATIVGTPN